MRPQDLSEFVGQEHILGPGKLLRRAIEADRLMSLILYGPPGVGKTALAHLIAERSRAHFVPLNAVTAGVADIRKVAQESALERTSGGTQGVAEPTPIGVCILNPL
jgi:putative ATPase